MVPIVKDARDESHRGGEWRGPSHPIVLSFRAPTTQRTGDRATRMAAFLGLARWVGLIGKMDIDAIFPLEAYLSAA